MGLRCSADTLLRRVINTPETKQSGAPHVGIDEWAWHRGHRYGTLIVNLDTHRPLVLLPGRDQRTLATWFRKYPEIQIVSRDRSGVYATAAREGAPQARQVADRWHLLKNIGDALERMMYRHIPLIRLVASELSPKKSPDPEPSVPAASLRRPERLKQQTRKKRHQRWTEVMALHNKECSFREISRITGLSRVTVSRWVRSGTFPEMSTRPPKRGLLDPWREWLKEQRESSNYNASRIWREMVARVSRWLMPWRITRDEENYASRFISLMCEKEPELKIAQQLALEFYRILKTQNKSQLSSWFNRVHESGSAEFRRVAAGMEADAAAICEAISSRWSNGVVEGHVNRLKMLKRQMYGRAGFELLRQRVMSPLA
ncbi:transposase [Escherichia coli O145:NM str. 2010C-3517]|nr:transposase [Escherichia coli O145:NM str. 2010C-3517]